MAQHATLSPTSSRSLGGQNPAIRERKSNGTRVPESKVDGEESRIRRPHGNFPDTPEASVGRFLRALQAEQVAMRLYQKNHSLVMSAMEATEFHLRAALDKVSPITIGIEDGALVCWLGKGAEPIILESRKTWAGLAENWTQRSLRSLTFTPQTNLGELDVLARLLNSSSPRTDQEWQTQFAESGIAGIRANAPLRRPQGTILATLVSALIAHGGEERETPNSNAAPATLDDLTAALSLLARFEPIVRGAAQSNPQHTAETLHIALIDAERRTLTQIVRCMSRNAPRENEQGVKYLARLAEALLLETLREQFIAQRVAAPEIEGVFSALGEALVGAMNLVNVNPESASEASSLPPALVRAARALLPNISESGADAADACIARLHEEFWAGLPAREMSSVLRGPEAWCVPISVLRAYLEQLLSATRNSRGDAAIRESRIVIASYARGLESEEARPRRTAANGLVELLPTIEQLWREETPAELGRAGVRALLNEVSPGIAIIQVALEEGLAQQAISRGDFAEFERILIAVDSAPRDEEHSHLVTLEEKLMDDTNWKSLMDSALAARPLDAALPRILRRNPERLAEDLGAMLAATDGLNSLPAMARLVIACSETVLGVLEGHLVDPRRQRAATAVKLLSVADPQRLVAALPRALAGWDWNLQDLAVAELTRNEAKSKLEGVARVFVEVLHEAHPLVAPVMLDEIGLAGDASAVPLLCEIAEGEVEPLRDVFIRIKAIEALGRMRASTAAPLLRTLLRARQGLVHTEPAGLRAAAEEALALIENHPSSARVRANKVALEKASVSFSRPRRYFRIPLDHPYKARIEPQIGMPIGVSAPIAGEGRMKLRPDPRGVGKMAAARVRSISLGGAFLESEHSLTVGDNIKVYFSAVMFNIWLNAVVCNVSTGGGGVEFIHMPEDSRERLRRLVKRLVD